MLSKITKGKALIALYQQLLSVLQKDLRSLPLNIMQKNRKRGHNNSFPCCHFVLTCSSYEGHLVLFVLPPCLVSHVVLHGREGFTGHISCVLSFFAREFDG